MNRIRITYSFVVTFMMFFFTSFTMHAIQTEKDSLALAEIHTYRQEAISAIYTQDYDTAISSLSKANKLVTSIDDDALKATILLISAELHYYLQNYEKATSLLKYAAEDIKNRKTKKYAG